MHISSLLFREASEALSRLFLARERPLCLRPRHVWASGFPSVNLLTEEPDRYLGRSQACSSGGICGSGGNFHN